MAKILKRGRDKAHVSTGIDPTMRVITALSVASYFYEEPTKKEMRDGLIRLRKAIASFQCAQIGISQLSRREGAILKASCTKVVHEQLSKICEMAHRVVE